MVSKEKGLGGPFNNQNTTNGLGSWRSAMAPVGPLEVGGHLSLLKAPLSFTAVLWPWAIRCFLISTTEWATHQSWPWSEI